MFCVNCGNEIRDEAKFCPFCGFKVQTKVQDLEKEDKAEDIEHNIVPEENFIEETTEPLNEEIIEERNKSTFNIPSIVLLVFIVLIVLTWNFGGLKLNKTINVSFNELFEMFVEYKDTTDVGMFPYINTIFYTSSIILGLSCLYCFLLNKKGALNRILIILFGCSIVALFVVFHQRFLNNLDINLLEQVNLFGFVCIGIIIVMVLFSFICLVIRK